MDIIFLHCPSYFDFRNELLVTGAFTDAIPNSAVYEMYPMGLLSMTATLQKYGFKAGIINIANRMIQNPNINIEKLLKNLKADIFGIDLHWMIHSQGVFSIASLLKKVQPNAKIVLGGFTSSYFAKEIMTKFPQIDFILRGDTVEKLIVQLLNQVQLNHRYEGIPNLMWRDENKKIRENDWTYVPKEIVLTNEDFAISIALMIKDMLDLQIFNFLPNANYPKKIGVPIMFCKGCTQNCVNCGASAYANKRVLNRDHIALKKPEVVAAELVNVYNSYDFPLRFFGDFRIAGPRYVDRLIKSILRFTGGKKIDAPAIFEYFWPGDEAYMREFQDIFHMTAIEMSPETGNDMVRNKQGRLYSNDSILRSAKKAKELGVSHLIYWFQIGNGFESMDSLNDTQHLCKDLIALSPDTIHPFLSPLCPYTDPGSLSFEHPTEHGYKIFYPTLEQQIKGFEKPIWKYYLNYETLNFTRDMIVNQAYIQGKLLNDTKMELGAMSEEDCVYLNRLLDISHRLVKLIDRGIENKALEIKSEKIKDLFNVRNTMRMKMKHDLLAKALGSFHLSHHGVQFAGWRLKLLLETGSLFYRQ